MRVNVSRRRFLGTSLGVAATASMPAAAAKMKLSLSVRVAEAFDDKTKTTMPFEEIVKIATSDGYPALCMRASVAGIHSPPEAVRAIARQIRQAGLVVSMVTGDVEVPSNNDHGPDGLRRIKPYLDLAESFGADLIRICMKKDEDIPWAQKASDEARERKIRLAHQSHCASLFETVDGSLRVLRAVNRANFGLIYEPANWFIAAQNYGRDAIRRLQPYIFNVYVQNHRLTPEGKAAVLTWTRGKVPLDHIGLWESGGVNFPEVFAGLDAIGYRRFLTVHQAFAGVMLVQEAARRSYQYLKRFTG
jgi:sugar phosphate isomerase/epimerase